MKEDTVNSAASEQPFRMPFYINTIKEIVNFMEKNLKKTISLAMLSAIAFAVMVVGRIPMVMFLKYDPKDVIIAIGGFIFGPLSAFIISAVVSLVEMVTVSDTGIIGCIMNIISSCSLVCTASYIYNKKRTLSGAVTGLIAGTLFTTVVMLLWNYLITPLYMGYPREDVTKLLIPVFLPFNLIKGGINTAITLLLYKPVVTALRRAKLIETSENGTPQSGKTGITLIAVLLLATCIFFALVLKGII